MVSNWSNLVARRDLLRELTLSELRTQREISRFGWVWWLVDPLIMMLIYWAVVVGIFGRGGQYAPYPVFILCAMLPWKHFTSSLTASSGVLRAREGLIKSLAFPTMALPLTLVFSRFSNFLFGTLALLAVVLVAGMPVGISMVQVPFLLFAQITLVTGLCLVVSCLGALIRDLHGFLGHLTRVGFYLSPTLYGIDIVIERSADLGAFWGVWLPRLYLLNPFAVLITGYRDSFFYGRFMDPELWILLVVQSSIALLAGYRTYQYFDRRVIKFL
ncbi:MAG: ABC transporter permease [Myxococcota bacterium]|nr:ABC transporter permease [Myxococcota bacterium]